MILTHTYTYTYTEEAGIRGPRFLFFLYYRAKIIRGKVQWQQLFALTTM